MLKEIILLALFLKNIFTLFTQGIGKNFGKAEFS